MNCIKKSTGMSAKKDVKCSQIFSMFFLFVLASFSATIGLLASISIRFIYEEKRDASLTPQEKSIIVYKDELEYELITRLIGLFTCIQFAHNFALHWTSLSCPWSYREQVYEHDLGESDHWRSCKCHYGEPSSHGLCQEAQPWRRCCHVVPRQRGRWIIGILHRLEGPLLQRRAAKENFL